MCISYIYNMKNITIDFIMTRTDASYNDVHQQGIYRIYHIAKPDISYIGSAASSTKWRRGFRQRWTVHIKELRANIHHSLFLQRVVNKHGIEGLRFEILEICSSEKCLEREQHWLDIYKPFGEQGYNSCPNAGNSLGYRFPEELKSNRKPICQYSPTGEFIKRWDSLNQASRELNINVSSIKDCCKRRFNQIKGFIFRYEGEIDLPKVEDLRIPMQIECIFNEQVVHVGTFSEIKKFVPDTKFSIYKSINTGSVTKNNYKYSKKLTK